MKLAYTFITLTAACILWANPKSPGTTGVASAPVFQIGPEEDVEGVGLLRRVETITADSVRGFDTSIDGTRFLVLRIATGDSPAGRLYIRNMALPPKAKLYVYGLDASGSPTTSVGPYRRVGPMESGDFFTGVVAGPEIVVELQSSEVLPDLPFEIVGFAPSDISEVTTSVSMSESDEEVRTSMYRGMALTHAVRNGKAIFEGDIELGDANELPRADSRSKNGLREAVAITGSQNRWPNGIIPYTIDPAIPSPQRITDAISHWNTKLAGHIQWVPKTDETAFVNFRHSASASSCSSAVGRTGYQQSITLGTSCAKGHVIHEMGHVVGLWHEQSREDRNTFVIVRTENLQSGTSHNFTQNISTGDDLGAYDYGSIMHYPSNAFSANGKPTIETIPSGISIGQRTALSVGDVVAVKSMYPLTTGVAPPPTVTFESIPSGLTIKIDNVNYKTPKSFQWAPGTVHTVSALNPAVASGTRNLFVRWTDKGAQTHTIVAPTASTVYRADYATSYSAVIAAAPASFAEAAGTVMVSPMSSDNFYPKASSVQLEALPAPNYCFTSWTGLTAGTPAKTKLSIQKAYTVQANYQSGSISVSPASLTVPIKATTQQISVNATGGCVWTATSPVTWAKITAGASGTGPGTVTLSVAARSSTSAARTATLTIAGQAIVITQ